LEEFEGFFPFVDFEDFEDEAFVDDELLDEAECLADAVGRGCVAPTGIGCPPPLLYSMR
jgi:hypothetical protein